MRVPARRLSLTIAVASLALASSLAAQRGGSGRTGGAPARTAASAATPTSETVPPSTFAALRWRMVGPARGGRVTTVTGVDQDPFTFYFGSTGGGVWKTTDAGATWQNVSDGQITVGSMGDIDVANRDRKSVV